MFKRKREDVIPQQLEMENSDNSANDPLGLPKDDEMSIPEVEVNPIHEQYKTAMRNTGNSNQAGMDTKDVQLIISKLDLINARLENLNERILSLERAFANQEKRRW